MTIAFGASGSAIGGTTSLALPYPSGITAGQMLVMFIANKYPAAPPTTPAGWQLQATVTGGSGASGVDTGQTRSSIYTRIAVGTETGNVDVTITGGNCAEGRIIRYTKAAAKTWGVAATSGPQNTGNSLTWTATATGPLGITVGDMILTASAVNTDAFGWTVQTLTASGCTFTRAERLDGGTTSGDDIGAELSEHLCTAGTFNGTPAMTMTGITGTPTTDAPAGCTVWLVLREVTPPPCRLGLNTGLGL